MSNRLRYALRGPLFFSLLFVSAAMVLNAGVAVTGTISSLSTISSTQFLQGINLSLTGANFSLNSSIGSRTLIQSYGATFVPAVTIDGSTLSQRSIILPSGSDSGTLVYNGTTYTNLQIDFRINAASATVTPNVETTSYPPTYASQASVNSVPFSLTGTVSAYAAPPLSAGFTDAPLVSVNFSGGGLFSGAADEFSTGAIAGESSSSTYALLPNPINFTTDSTTKGAWTGNYGGEGYLIANGPVFLPAYAAISVTQAATFTWASPTSDPRALQNGLNAASGIASSYYGNNFNINIAFTDNNPHRVALYLLDFDTANTRDETLTVINANTGAVLDAETITSFSNGVWAIWNLQGNITINVKRVSGAAAVISGIFFGSPATILNVPTTFLRSSATYQGANTTIKGAWQGQYGYSGYTIANGPNATPTLGAINVIGASTYTWAAQTSDPRALQTNPQDTSGIASAYTQYPNNSFKISVSIPTNGTSNGTAALSLYLLDWDNEGRSETITFTDLSTGIVLDTVTFANFQGGIYATWIISGNVVATVTPNGPSSPAVSGIFLN